jgi:hypothetical protein
MLIICKEVKKQLIDAKYFPFIFHPSYVLMVHITSIKIANYFHEISRRTCTGLTRKQTAEN